MKIRTDFVTNSSSSTTTEVVIDNPILLGILQKYKDMGLFGNHTPIFGIGSYDSSVEYHPNSSKLHINRPPAFYFLEESVEGSGLTNVDDTPPESLEGVLENIINILENLKSEYLDEILCNRMVEELRFKNEEILQGYKNVDWNYALNSDWVIKSTFQFDKKLGERLIVTDLDWASAYHDEDNSDGEDYEYGNSEDE